jgi:hypothetical protein
MNVLESSHRFESPILSRGHGGPQRCTAGKQSLCKGAALLSRAAPMLSESSHQRDDFFIRHLREALCERIKMLTDPMTG